MKKMILALLALVVVIGIFAVPTYAAASISKDLSIEELYGIIDNLQQENYELDLMNRAQPEFDVYGNLIGVNHEYALERTKIYLDDGTVTHRFAKGERVHLHDIRLSGVNTNYCDPYESLAWEDWKMACTLDEGKTIFAVSRGDARLLYVEALETGYTEKEIPKDGEFGWQAEIDQLDIVKIPNPNAELGYDFAFWPTSWEEAEKEEKVEEEQKIEKQDEVIEDEDEVVEDEDEVIEDEDEVIEDEDEVIEDEDEVIEDEDEVIEDEDEVIEEDDEVVEEDDEVVEDEHIYDYNAQIISDVDEFEDDAFDDPLTPSGSSTVWETTTIVMTFEITDEDEEEEEEEFFEEWRTKMTFETDDSSSELSENNGYETSLLGSSFELDGDDFYEASLLGSSFEVEDDVYEASLLGSSFEVEDDVYEASLLGSSFEVEGDVYEATLLGSSFEVEGDTYEASGDFEYADGISSGDWEFTD